uniref:G-protein coupled receptors family 1 profile domain-containing protein n=1 Tax=Trichogramma kaykai TaxID=54128 RepID=A0ABD2WRC3_9HYME
MRAHSRARAQFASAPQRVCSCAAWTRPLIIYINARSSDLGIPASRPTLCRLFIHAHAHRLCCTLLFPFVLFFFFLLRLSLQPTEIRSDVKLSFSSSAFRSSNSSIASSNSFKQLLISVSVLFTLCPLSISLYNSMLVPIYSRQLHGLPGSIVLDVLALRLRLCMSVHDPDAALIAIAYVCVCVSNAFTAT